MQTPPNATQRRTDTVTQSWFTGCEYNKPEADNNKSSSGGTVVLTGKRAFKLMYDP